MGRPGTGGRNAGKNSPLKHSSDRHSLEEGFAGFNRSFVLNKLKNRGINLTHDQAHEKIVSSLREIISIHPRALDNFGTLVIIQEELKNELKSAKNDKERWKIISGKLKKLRLDYSSKH